MDSDGEDAADLCAHYWFELDPWQELILHDWLARDENGRLLVLTAGLSCPRQNGKNGTIEALEFYLMLTDPDTHILHTAHQVKTAKKAFNRLAKIFGNKRNKEVYKLVKQIRRTNGEEGIYLWHPDHIGDETYSGASIEYSARSRASSRGFDKISVIVYDEAQELTDEHIEALMFTLGASDTDRMMIYIGTPPGPGCPGEVFTRVRTRAFNNPTPRTSWHEWSVEKLPDKDSTFEDLLDEIYETNPGMGVRLSIEMTEEEFANATLDGFARERLGWWLPVVTIGAAIPRQVWMDSETGPIADRFQGVVSLGIKFSPDGAYYAMAGCKARRNKSHFAFELIEVKSTERGTLGLAQALAKKANEVSCVVIDGINGADTLCDHLASYKAPDKFVMRLPTAKYIAAIDEFIDGLKAKRALHPFDAALYDAATNAKKRFIGGKGAWGFDVPEMDACALAVYGARHTSRDPNRKQRLV